MTRRTLIKIVALSFLVVINAFAQTDGGSPSITTTGKPVTLRITLGSDDAFDMNRSILKEPAKDRLYLDVIAPVLKWGQITSITVTGHTDKLGSQDFNRRLSDRRAVAVKNYMIKQGVKGDVITTIGKGDSQPVKDCKQVMDRKSLAKCLAPNRRVVVEAKGTAK